MNRPTTFKTVVIAAALALGLATSAACASTFSVGYQDGSSWNTVYAQGFSPAVSPNPNPGLAAGDPVLLNTFKFYKSGNADSASNIRLAILDGLFPNIAGLNSGAFPVVGLSTNTIGGTAGLATGDAFAFDFAPLSLAYGGEYAAVFVSEGAGGALTPVLVSALTADYVDNGAGTFVPETNYGANQQFQFAVSNFISTNMFGSFFNTFSFAADANFEATFSAVPEPGSALLLGLSGVTLAGACRRFGRGPVVG